MIEITWLDRSTQSAEPLPVAQADSTRDKGQTHGALCGKSQTHRPCRSSFILLVNILLLVHWLPPWAPSCRGFPSRQEEEVIPCPSIALEFRTSLQKLLVGLILILVPLTVFGFYVAIARRQPHTAGER